MKWMREELDGLQVDSLAFRDTVYNRYVLGKEDKVTKKMNLKISTPDPNAPIHSQMKKGWFILEGLPRLRRRSRWPDLPSFLGYYLPLGQYRYIPSGAHIHSTALERRDNPENPYDPPNLKDF